MVVSHRVPPQRVDLMLFVFKPVEKEYGFAVRLARGTLVYIPGIIANLAPEAISIETPTATLGGRGTRLLARAGEQCGASSHLPSCSWSRGAAGSQPMSWF